METSSTTSQGGLDARQLNAQLPPGFNRGDEAAIDAVMQLAAFNEQQQHHNQQPHPHSEESIQEGQGSTSQEGKPSRKRKGDQAGATKSSNKVKKDDESQEASQHPNWASFTGHANEFEHLIEHGGGGEEEQEPSVDKLDDSIMTSDGEVLTRHGRPLSTTKRAAQNRAAQRAFRERRDQHVKDVEAKAKQVDEALKSASMHKQRYHDLLKTIAGLRADNQSLRLAIHALGGNVPPPPQLVPSFSNIEGQEGDSQTWRGDSFQETKSGEYQDTKGEQGDNHLDGLSAVAAAAAAAATAAAHAAQQDEDGDSK